jgi:hypothetical protein
VGADNQVTYQCAFDSASWVVVHLARDVHRARPREPAHVRRPGRGRRRPSGHHARQRVVRRREHGRPRGQHDGRPRPGGGGRHADWTTRVRNAGVAAATGVAVTGTTASDARAVCTSAAGSVRCDLADLADLAGGSHLDGHRPRDRHRHRYRHGRQGRASRRPRPPPPRRGTERRKPRGLDAAKIGNGR